MPGCRPTKRLLPILGICCAQLLLGYWCAAQGVSGGGGAGYSRGFAVPRDDAQNQPPTYTVDGVIKNSLTHEPIARVLVQGMQDKVLTDSEGRFELQLPQGSFMIRLQRPGYGSEGPNSETMHLVNVEPGMSPMTLFLTPSASIVAHVVLSTGDPPDGINFSLYRRSVVDGHAQWIRSGNAVADSGGTARFFSLDAPGAYVFCSNSSPDTVGTSASRGPAFGYPSLCFPGGTDFASAITSPLMIHAGQQAEVDADLARQPFYSVTISVPRTPEGGMPTPQAYTSSGQSMGFAAFHGTYSTFNLPNGNYYAEASFNSGKGPNRYGRVDFTVAGGPVSGLSLALLPVQPIAVEIHRELTAESNEGPVFFSGPGPVRGNGEPGPPLDLGLIPADNLNSGAYAGGLRRDPDAPYGDLYQLQISLPGRYWVHVNPYGPYYVSSIVCGGVDLAIHPLVVGPGGTSYPIEITLRNDMGRLTMMAAPSSAASAEGTESGEAAGILIYAIPLFPSTAGIHQWAAQSAPFNFSTELPPGDYVIVATGRARDFDLDDPREMARLTSQGQKVTIEAGQTATVVLNKLISHATEAGQ